MNLFKRIPTINNKKRIIKNISLFKKRVLRVVSRIRRGSTLSYKEVATRAGNSGAYRAVGTILKNNFNPLIPCHRVICSDGRIGEYNRGASAKISLLKKEGAIKTSR